MPGIQINLTFLFYKASRERGIIHKIAGTAEGVVISNRTGTHKMNSLNGVILEVLFYFIFRVTMDRQYKCETAIWFLTELF